MSGGFIYVLTNPCMPGLVKIGRTKNHPLERASALFTTGVPSAFEVAFAMWCEDAVHAEADIHDKLSQLRESPNREFFRMEACEAVKEVASRILADDDLCVTSEFDCAESQLAYIQHVTGCHFTETVRLLMCISDSDWVHAYRRLTEHKMRRLTMRGQEQ